MVDNDASVIYKAAENDCDLVLLHLTTPLQDSLVTVSVRRIKLPHVKIVGFSVLSIADLQKQVSPKAGFDAVTAQEDGLSKLVETLKALMPEPPRR